MRWLMSGNARPDNLNNIWSLAVGSCDTETISRALSINAVQRSPCVSRSEVDRDEQTVC